MKSNPIRKLTMFAAAMLYAGSLYGSSLTVSAMANIWGAGLSVPPAGVGGSGVVPPSFTFAAGAGDVLTFSSVTGEASFGGSIYCPPDGCPSGTAGNAGTDENAEGGISGIIDDPGNIFFFIGVFLANGNQPGTAPPALNFTGDQNFTTIDPQLGQLFFVGDGQNNESQTQFFDIPTTATALYLGFADGDGFVGNSGSYSDNVGSLTATFGIAAAAPEPASLLLAGIALIALGFAPLRARTTRALRSGDPR